MMKYDRQQLVDRMNQGEVLAFQFFWRHSGNNQKSCLSQWYPCKIHLNGNVFHSAEQYMMAQKAMLFQDKQTFERIMKADNPRQCKALGREVKGFDEKMWDAAKYKIVLDANYLKFTQNDKLRRFLLATGKDILVEASPYDKVWGIGMDEKSPDANNPALWIEKNMLGFALMEVRDMIKNDDEEN